MKFKLLGCFLLFAMISLPIYSLEFSRYDPLLVERKIIISSIIDNKTSKEVISKLFFLNNLDSEKPINLYINTMGGWLDDAMAISDTIKTIKAPVNTWAIGGCKSSGGIILASGTGKRRMFPNAIFQIHGGTGYQTGIKYSMASVDDARIDNFWKNNANLPKEWFPLAKKEYYFTASEALKFKVIDEIVPIEERTNKSFNILMPDRSRGLLPRSPHRPGRD